MQFLRSLRLYRALRGGKWYEHRDDHGTVTWLHERETRKHLQDQFTGVMESYRRSFKPGVSIHRLLRNMRWYRRMQGGSWRQVSYGLGRTWVPKEEAAAFGHVYRKERWGTPEGHQTA